MNLADKVRHLLGLDPIVFTATFDPEPSDIDERARVAEEAGRAMTEVLRLELSLMVRDREQRGGAA